MKKKSKVLQVKVVQRKATKKVNASTHLQQWKKWEKYLIDNRLMKENEECLF